MEDISQLLTKQEELNPELKAYLVDIGVGMRAIKHPIVFAVPYFETENALLNQRLEIKTEALNKALDEGRILSYIFLHERPFRLEAFMDIVPQIDGDKLYWETLGNIWSDSENIWEHMEEWRELLTSNRPYREFFMEEDERKAFGELPEKLVVYRGYIPEHDNKNGFSWTLEKKRAEWFAKRHRRNGKVCQKTIKKSDIFAYLTSRDEEEIIIL